MGIQDKLTGRLKQAVGDLTGNPDLRRQGLREERKADAERELIDTEREVERKRAEVARLEYGESAADGRGDGSERAAASHPYGRADGTRDDPAAGR